jgi:hypothetical protein
MGLIQESSGCQKNLLFDFKRWIFDAVWHGVLMTTIIIIVFVDPRESDPKTGSSLIRDASLKD